MFKYLSSDFLGTYNDLMEELSEKQANLDTYFKDKVDEIVKREKARLESNIPKKFLEGDTVEIIGPLTSFGRVVSSHIEFEVEIDSVDGRGEPLYGPGRYFPVRNQQDEDVVTCQGMIRKYSVATTASEIQKDWGVSEVISSYYEDELIDVK